MLFPALAAILRFIPLAFHRRKHAVELRVHLLDGAGSLALRQPPVAQRSKVGAGLRLLQAEPLSVQTTAFVDHLHHGLTEHLQLLPQDLGGIDEAMPRDIGLHFHRLSLLDHRHPFAGISGAHGGEDAVQIGLAHEEDVLFGKMDD